MQRTLQPGLDSETEGVEGGRAPIGSLPAGLNRHVTPQLQEGDCVGSAPADLVNMAQKILGVLVDPIRTGSLKLILPVPARE